MASRTEEIAALYLTNAVVLVQPIATLSATFFIYGIYVLVFGMAIGVLFRRDSPASKLYRWCTISLFALATIYVGTSVWNYSRQATIYFEATKTRNYDPLLKYVRGDVGKSAFFGTVSLVVAFMNIIADWMLIHRCYVIWESNRVVLYSFSSIAMILNGLNVGTYIAGVIGVVSTSSVAKYQLFHYASEINNGCNVAIAIFSLILTFTTGGRIWWISREARKLIGKPIHQRYISVVAIIVESGLLYATVLLLNVILQLTVTHNCSGAVPFVVAPISALMSGLAPTLIIVRAADGRTVDNVNQMVSSLHFADGDVNQERSRTRPQSSFSLRRYSQPLEEA